MKVGSFKLVIAEDPASVKEVLVKKSADYAGRPPFHSFLVDTLGNLFTCNNYILLARRFLRLSIPQMTSDSPLVKAVMLLFVCLCS